MSIYPSTLMYLVLTHLSNSETRILKELGYSHIVDIKKAMLVAFFMSKLQVLDRLLLVGFTHQN